MNPIQLIALDLDGTLLDSNNQISETNRLALKRAIDSGIEVIASTGRPYSGLPVKLLTDIGIRYAITVNGAATYRIPQKECLFEECIPKDLICLFLSQLMEKDILFDVFINGIAYTQENKRPLIEKMLCPDYYRHYMYNSRTSVEDLLAFVENQSSSIQKGTINFYPLSDGSYQDYDAVVSYFADFPQIMHVCGGFHNLEFTQRGVSKASALKQLAHSLNIPIENTMACGDTENDLDMIQAAGIGVAMENAENSLKEAADYITLSNDKNGIAHAFEHLVFSK